MAEKEEFTDDQIKAFAEKLQSWGESLPEPERELLAHILLSASSEDDEEVRGYLLGEGMAWAAYTSTDGQEAIARSIRTGATIKVKATSVPAFKAGQEFKST